MTTTLARPRKHMIVSLVAHDRARVSIETSFDDSFHIIDSDNKLVDKKLKKEDLSNMKLMTLNASSNDDLVLCVPQDVSVQYIITAGGETQISSKIPMNNTQLNIAGKARVRLADLSGDLRIRASNNSCISIASLRDFNIDANLNDNSILSAQQSTIKAGNLHLSDKSECSVYKLESAVILRKDESASIVMTNKLKKDLAP